MEKKNFVTLILGSISIILFGLGMCMALLPEWHSLNQGIIMGIIGLVLMLVLYIVRRKMDHKPAIKFNLKTMGIAIYGIISLLVLGIGMTFTMVYSDYLMMGIIIGVVGILLLIGLIPMVKGIK